MKRFVFVGILCLLSMGVFAQAWTVDGNVYLENYNWDYEYSVTGQTTYSLSLIIGRYFTDNLNIGLRGGFATQTGKNIDPGFSLTVGPRIKYDFYHFERVYFSIWGNLTYTRYNNYITYNNIKQSANRIWVYLEPSITFQINETIEVYWLFAGAYYRVTMYEESPVTISLFEINGPFTSPSFGLTFRF